MVPVGLASFSPGQRSLDLWPSCTLPGCFSVTSEVKKAGRALRGMPGCLSFCFSFLKVFKSFEGFLDALKVFQRLFKDFLEVLGF